MADLFGIVSGAAAIFGAMPLSLQLFLVAGIFFVDDYFFDFSDVLSDIFVGWIGLEFNAFFFFVLFFVAGLISTMHMANRWYGSG